MADDPAARDRERTEALSDEEAEAVRIARFGRPPSLIGPEAWVTEVDLESWDEPPVEVPFDPRHGSDPG